ncbi:MAG TPA: heme peroxidase family protein [Acidimicrobiales bacterium]|nr:heme peroxidase family protein [Acidimicrobiales bacterium]
MNTGREPAGEALPARPRADPIAPFAAHGGDSLRGIEHAPRSVAGAGRFGRMFPDLSPFVPERAVLEALARSMLPGTPAAPPGEVGPEGVLEPGDNPDLAAGYTYLGQFVDHDITFDPVSSLERNEDPAGLRSFRSPRFDLDSLYGSGPVASPHLYDQEDPVKLLVGRNTGPAQEPEDLPRNQQGRALIEDPRNDVHAIISQLHLAFIRFHNAVVDHLRDSFLPAPDLFTEAQRLTRWHYQWVVVEDYLRRLVGPEILSEVLQVDPATGARSAVLRFYKWQDEPFIPVEFSAAAFRFGHSQVRARYRLTADGELLHILVPILTPNPFQHLGGFRPLPKNWRVQWDLFVSMGGSSPQLSRRIDTKVTGPFTSLPTNIDPERRSLPLLNLLRGRALGLPSGQAVAGAMGTSMPDRELGLGGPAPLWYYLLRESERVTEGRRLGPTAGRIVAEVLLGMLAADPSSYFSAPHWTPELPGQEPGQFALPDLLRFAGVA